MEAVEGGYGPLTVHPKTYLFFPTQKEQKTEEGKKGSRFFYYGQIQNDEYEKKKLREFQEYVTKNKIEYDRKFYHDQRLVLFLQGNSYKPKETLEAMKVHSDFISTSLPIQFSRVQKLVRAGFLYPCGRDRHFRPIMVFNATLVDFKDMESSFLTTCFVQQELIKGCFIDGQCENWIVIYDLGKMGVSELPMSAIKNISQRISLHYGGRLYRMYIVNAPGTIWFTWKIASAFLDPVTVDKIKLSKTNTDKAMLEHIDPSQFEQKYGGAQPNRTNYWPFGIPEAVYDEKRLVSMQEYEGLLKQGKLQNNAIHPAFREKKEE